jgi:hypothetical protein
VLLTTVHEIAPIESGDKTALLESVMDPPQQQRRPEDRQAKRQRE